MIWNYIIQAVLFVASVAYQRKQQDKLKSEQERRNDLRKGQEVVAQGTASTLPVVYGLQKLGGVRLPPKVRSTFTHATSGASGKTFSNSMGSDKTGSKNEFLFVQQAVCWAPIQEFITIEIDDRNFESEEFQFGQRTHAFKGGGVADPMTVANGFSANKTFTNVAYTSSCFRLNRDDPQYSGIPTVTSYVKGRTVRVVSDVLGPYALSDSETYSSNPAYCLLDYLMNTDYGVSVSESEVDLQSFYETAQVCDTIVSTGKKVTGRAYGGDGTQDIKKHTCDITLDTANPKRSNILQILGTMGDAQLVWNGKYYLRHVATENAGALEYSSTITLTPDDIIRDSFILSFPKASERLNQMTVSFANAFDDFKTDSVTWPKTTSGTYATYLAEDSGVPLQQEQTMTGISNPYHARAYAIETVKMSRNNVAYEFVCGRAGIGIEPNDIITIEYPDGGITVDSMLVKEVQVLPNFLFRIKGFSFDSADLAWQAVVEADFKVYEADDFKIPPVTGLTYTAGTPGENPRAIGNLTWVEADISNETYVVSYTTADTTSPVFLTETKSPFTTIFARNDWAEGEAVSFTVKTRSNLGALALGVTVAANVTQKPMAPTSFSSAETLYQTNKASGVKARATLSFSEPSGGVAVKDFKVEYYRSEDNTVYKTLGFTVGETFTFDDVRAGTYSFRITPISWSGYAGPALVGSKTILGLSAIPADPTGFISKVTDAGILLTWNTPSDLDVVSGGTTEIRYVRNDVVTPKWEIAQTIVNNISGSTTTATLPVSAGYYLIKHIDSSGNACAEPAQLLNSFVGPDFNAVATITEDPTFAGTKTGCTVVGSNLELDALASTMTYLFNNDIDLGSVENIRLVPSLTALITDGASVVADYALVSAVTRFSGPIVDASLTFEVRTTSGDPAGTPTWSAWETFTIGNYRARGLEFRLTGVVASTDYTISISELSLTADKADVYKRGTSTSSAGANTTVTFASAFYGGIGGTDLPHVGFSTIGGSAGDSINIVSVTKSAFVYSVYNSGARVVRNISWQAIGQ